MKSPGQIIYEAISEKWAELNPVPEGYTQLPFAPWKELSDTSRACYEAGAVALLEAADAQ